MWQRLHRGIHVSSVFLVSATMILPVQALAGLPKKNVSNVQRLAGCIDKLESHVDQYGSVVPKQPDIWGQARLQKYRRMVDEVLVSQKGEFKQTINASISRSDQASFANSLALQAAVSGPQAIVTRRGGSTVVNNSSTPAPTVIQPPDAVDPKSNLDLDSLKFGATKANNQQFPAVKGASDGIALEPNVMLDQLTTYLNHLNQLRRTNEGDDTADAPGYALHLVRIPVSVLPGKKTQQGYGAEITITAEAVINDSLLPTVFRSLIKNDVIDLASAVMFEIPAAPPKPEPEAVPPSPAQGDTYKKQTNAYNTELARCTAKMKRIGLRFSSPAQGGTSSDPAQSSNIFSEKMIQALSKLKSDLTFDATDNQSSKPYLILDLRKLAERQIEAAYTLLAAPGNDDLWRHANSELLTAIRNCNQGDETHAFDSVETKRSAFVTAIQNKSGNSLKENEDPVVGLAWAIIYKSTLLNQQLMDDMNKVAADQGQACHIGDQWYEFFSPKPMQGEPSLFAQYVRARWPIHVFAIDPMTTDQNVADTFSRRRDMQLALSLAFTSGQINAQNFTRYARRLELDMETIALNRTQVGFSHGSDTFGWRFYPRVQSPPTEGNAKVLFRDLLIGGPSRNAELNTMKLEPGARECVALVIMPSFVPSVRFDTRTNWFKLSNPKHKEFDLQTNVQLGTDITCLREFSSYCQNDPSVRGTDLALLLRTVDQLEHRLPLQTCVSQVPFELTHSGHTLFNHGVSDLGPRLRGYYGEPGAKDKNISVAVIGTNFSVSDTQVIAGNVLLNNGGSNSQVTMLSREVMLLTIPADALKEGNKIDVHVATPYGVSNHLDIHLPVPPKEAPPSVWTVKPQAANCTYAVDNSKKPDEEGYFYCVSYTPAVTAQFGEELKTRPNLVAVTFETVDLGRFTVDAVWKKGTSDYVVDVKSLANKLLDALVDNKTIDANSPPETNKYELSVTSVKVDDSIQPTNGKLVITFKPQPPAKK